MLSLVHYSPTIYLLFISLCVNDRAIVSSYTYMHACTRMHTHARMHMHAHVCTCTRTHTHAHTYARTHTRMHMHTHTHTHTLTHTHTHTRTHTVLSYSRSGGGRRRWRKWPINYIATSHSCFTKVGQSPNYLVVLFFFSFSFLNYYNIIINAQIDFQEFSSLNSYSEETSSALFIY